MDNLLALSARHGRRAASRRLAMVAVALLASACGGTRTEPATVKPTMSATDAKLITGAPAGFKAAIVHVMGFGTASVAIQGASQECMSFDWDDPVHYSQVCWAYVPTNGTVTAVATPTNGSKFLGWGTGPCAGSQVASCALSMDKHQISNVGFDPGGATQPKSEYGLKVDVLGFVDGEIGTSPNIGLVCQPSGRVSIEKVCTATVAAGTQVTLTATATVAGSSFTGWGGQCSGTGPCTFTMDRDVGVTAGFAMPGSGGGGGTGGGGGGGTTGAPAWAVGTWTGCGNATVTATAAGVATYSDMSGAHGTGTLDASGNYALTGVGSSGAGFFAHRGLWTQVSANVIHVFADLSLNGTDWTPGGGMNCDMNRTVPGGGTGVPGPTTPRISAHTQHSAAINSDGTLWGWGANARGQVGDGTRISRYVPVLIGSGYSAIALGFYHSVALKQDGTLWAWGWNFLGTVGDGTNVDRPAPVNIGSGYASIAAGEGHSFAIKPGGMLWGWGYNGYGQLGDGTTTDRNQPTFIGGGFAMAAAGFHHSAGVKSDGTLWTWGENYYGQLGDGSGLPRATPVQIGTGFTSVAAGYGHTVAVKADGSLWAWGWNSQGQLGDGTSVSQSLPVQIGTGYIQVSTSLHHNVALKADGSLWAWGSNSSGQLGDGTRTNRYIPTLIGTGYVAAVAGSAHTLAMKADGSLWSWGNNGLGQIGDGTVTSRTLPGPVGPPGSGLAVASTLVFSQEPPIDVTIGVPVAPVVCARVLDQFANPFTGGTFPVTLAPDLLSSSLSLDAPALTVQSVNGEACFPGLQAITAPSPAGAQARMVASSPGLGSAMSGRFNVNQPAARRVVGGTVSGLVGTGLVLQNNGGDDLPVAASGAFSFPTTLADGTIYTVTVASQPTSPAQACTVTHGSGAAIGSDVTSVAVNCTTQPPGSVENVLTPFLATPAAGAIAPVPVLTIHYLPTTDGVNLDVARATDFWAPGPITLANLERNIQAYETWGKFMLEEGSRFRGYKDPNAPPYLGYRVVKSFTVYDQVPMSTQFFAGTAGGHPVAYPDFHRIASDFDFRHYVEDLGVKEIWIWYGQSAMPGWPSYDPAVNKPEYFVEFIESNMSSPTTGDISNSYRTPNDLPVYSKTYVVYGYNFRRTQAEMVHNHGHQLESIYKHVAGLQDGTNDLFLRDFSGWGSNYSAPPLGRAGDTHHPPNTGTDYDYYNATVVMSDIEDWRPDHLGAQKPVNVATWSGLTYPWPVTAIPLPQQGEAQWYLYWMQSMPGYGNVIPYQSTTMSNWWEFTADWDAAIQAGKGLHR